MSNYRHLDGDDQYVSINDGDGNIIFDVTSLTDGIIIGAGQYANAMKIITKTEAIETLKELIDYIEKS